MSQSYLIPNSTPIAFACSPRSWPTPWRFSRSISFHRTLSRENGAPTVGRVQRGLGRKNRKPRLTLRPTSRDLARSRQRVLDRAAKATRPSSVERSRDQARSKIARWVKKRSRLRYGLNATTVLIDIRREGGGAANVVREARMRRRGRLLDIRKTTPAIRSASPPLAVPLQRKARHECRRR